LDEKEYLNPFLRRATVSTEFKITNAEFGEAVNDIKIEVMSSDFYVGKWLTTIIGSSG
jgi:hypothetical protein